MPWADRLAGGGTENQGEPVLLASSGREVVDLAEHHVEIVSLTRQPQGGA